MHKIEEKTASIICEDMLEAVVHPEKGVSFLSFVHLLREIRMLRLHL